MMVLVSELSDSEGLWELSAITAFWRDIDRPDITLQQTPELGTQYPLRLLNTVVKTGDLIDVQYLPPLAYYNGIETIKDLQQVAIYSGVVEEASIPFPAMGTRDQERFQEIKFQPKSSIAFMDLQFLDQKIVKGECWLDKITDGSFLNVLRIGDYVSVSWNSDSFMGDHCILRRHDSEFQALYSQGFVGNDDWVRAGNIKPTKSFTKRLSERLLKMGDDLHWSGRHM